MFAKWNKVPAGHPRHRLANLLFMILLATAVIFLFTRISSAFAVLAGAF